MNDTLSDFDHRNGHLLICNRNNDKFVIEDGRQMACNRDCASRLYDVAARLDQMLNPQAGQPVWPECDHHNETQHRDGLRPWCNACGWNRGNPAGVPKKVGTPRKEMPGYGVHQSWNPLTGYGTPSQ